MSIRKTGTEGQRAKMIQYQTRMLPSEIMMERQALSRQAAAKRADAGFLLARQRSTAAEQTERDITLWNEI